ICSLLLLFLVTYSTEFAQTTHRKPNHRNKTVSRSPKIFDTDGELISIKQMMAILESSNVKMEQIYKNGKPVGAKLIENEMVGKLPPDFSFKTMDDKEISLIQQREKLTVLNFWYVGCKPCLTEIPAFNKIVEKYKNNKDVEFFAVTFIASEDADGMTNLKSFLEKNRFDFQISIATKSVLDAFKINMYPQTIVLDKKGKIIFWRLYIGEKAQNLDKTLEDELNK
ncbi:MAG: peroxiredoxin family protein, partial [Pyrinomonadaceae bacterium]